MAKNSPKEVIETYRQRQGRRSLFTIADIATGLLFLIVLVSSIYVAVAGGPELPVLVDLKTNTPTHTPSITPTPSQTATITLTPTETKNPENQCDCPAPEVVIITATFSPTDTATPLPSPTERATDSILNAIATLTATETLPPSPADTPSITPTSTASITPTPTQIVYIVQPKDTLSGIALKYGVTVESIQTLNNLNTTIIYVGQQLQIPQP